MKKVISQTRNKAGEIKVRCLNADAFVRAFRILVLFDVSGETESISRSWKTV